MKHLFFFTSPLRDKILSLFLVLAAIPALLLGWITLVLLDQAHRQDVLVIEHETLRAKEEEVTTFFSDLMGVLDVRLEALDAAEITPGIDQWQSRLAEALRAEHDEFVEVLFVSPEGKETARASRTPRGGPLLYVSDLPAFKTALSGMPYIGSVYYTATGPNVVMASPVRAGEEVVQVVIAEIDLSLLVRSLTAHRLGETGYIVLADNRGVYVGTESFGSVKPGEHIVALIAQLDETDRYESIFSTTAVAGAKRVLLAGWTLIVEWPLAEVDTIIDDIREQIIVVVAASMLGVVFVAFLFAARIVYPIRSLEAGARRIEQGDFESGVFISTGDELEELGKAFSAMTKGLKRLQELKNEFVFIAAHELRAPTTVIKGYISMILEGDAGKFSGTLREYLTEANKANEQLLQLVNDLLEIARSEAGKIQIQVVPLDIRESIDTIREGIKPLMQEKRLTLSYERPTHALIVQADAVRLKEVIMNFVTNAIKYNRERGTITISHETKDVGVVTHIADVGFGIPKSEQGKIFEKFYRTAAARESGLQGTGLGLFITKELIERMEGTVWFHSEEGKGSTFSFSLPKGNDTLSS
ncbi:MAG: putative Histidine kinase [Parcubacteria group bacterium Gr01-1014_29]|nr:MAG: putative Histidine kinase [Parcubacteria group bacterium Gr01-1014_29]